MSKQPRLDAPGAFHHVMARGIDGTKIFSNRKDREDFFERLADLWPEWSEILINRLAVSDELREVKKYV